MAMGIGQQALASLTGNVETAMLVIYDYRTLGQEMTSNPASKAKNLVTSTAAALQTGSSAVYAGSQERILQVQFNPSQLTINGSAVPQGTLDATNGQGRMMAVEDAKLRLSVTLYFDDLNTFDAFMWDKFTAGITQGLSNTVSAVKTAKGKVHSVQGQVESLIAALRNPSTRKISFRWNQFVFTGHLNTVQAYYTMFSTSGRPIRAQMRLYIQHEMDPGALQSWYDNYKKAFGGDTGNLVKVEQNWSNLLNLNL